ncbi:hypothetical protein FHS29_006350 [Saccharothrix tamanrassetensis]|uniref:Secreted protein n=1 Tax=Saccharothrix tamanrassetensis TaxID=1051531 RepID=A0A841CR06_9PSEU|nr:hypothetical protein [Saccharothrix tamanrassetensis]MBB5959729.1 hypothetical protein [Saccharothrix tamanrassetensis]
MAAVLVGIVLGMVVSAASAGAEPAAGERQDPVLHGPLMMLCNAGNDLMESTGIAVPVVSQVVNGCATTP